MNLRKHGIDPELIERVKIKMKNQENKERIKMLLQHLTKSDLQNRAKVSRLLGIAAKTLRIKLSDSQAKQIVDFIIDQKIDPSNTFHLIKLWTIFR